MRADHIERFRRLIEADQQLAQWNGHERQNFLAAAFDRFLARPKMPLDSRA
jgi:hypothetical protein